MIRNMILVMAFAVVTATVSAAQADEGDVLSFKKPVVMGMIDGNLKKIDTSTITGVTGPYEQNGIFLDFTFNGQLYRVKASDTNFQKKIYRTCLPGEIKIAQSNQQIGATQMGSGESSCKPHN